jgi:fructose-1-phosphate kinase PfkB-like protein
MRFLTLTCNLLAETTYAFDQWSAGATQRARAESFQVGGKGINVTRMLQRMGADSVALCFPGGATGARCVEWLRTRGIPHHAIPVSAETRTGAVVRAPGRPETTFLGRENVVDGAAVAACAAFLDAQPGGQLLSIGGSIPAWTEPKWEPLRESFERWGARGTLVVDTYGPALQWFAARPAALAKINRKEFAGLAGVGSTETTDARMPGLLARVAQTAHIARWVITDGPNLVWSRDQDGMITCTPPPRVEEVSPTGSGDVFLAGLLHALLVRKAALAEAVALALPLGAANAASPEVAEFDLTPFGF